MDTENQVPKGGDDQPLGAKAKEVVGWATGDRAVEADGRAEADDDAPRGAVEEQVREDHGDIDPS